MYDNGYTILVFAYSSPQLKRPANLNRSIQCEYNSTVYAILRFHDPNHSISCFSHSWQTILWFHRGYP